MGEGSGSPTKQEPTPALRQEQSTPHLRKKVRKGCDRRSCDDDFTGTSTRGWVTGYLKPGGVGGSRKSGDLGQRQRECSARERELEEVVENNWLRIPYGTW